MSLYFNSRQKVDNFLRAIQAVSDGSPPLSSGLAALGDLRKLFNGLLQQIERAQALDDLESLSTLAQEVNVKIFETLPTLGFVSNSTSVKNAFEFLDPIQDMAHRLLQGRIPRLILSSEWDYIPFAYPQSLDYLPGFVLIGLPASESGSALLIPLAAHELGHAVWRNRRFEGGAAATIQYNCELLYDEPRHLNRFKRLNPGYRADHIVDKEILTDAKAASVDLATLHAEELFCDMLGYALFGSAYMYAFGYILSPGTGARSSKYPSYGTRISALSSIANTEGIFVPNFEELCFNEEAPRADSQTSFIIEMAGLALDKIKNGLWDLVINLLESKCVERPNIAMAERHLNEFRMQVPSGDPRCLGDIIIAGWLYYNEIKISSEISKEKARQVEHLNEMILKSVEVLEYNRRSKHGAKRARAVKTGGVGKRT